MTRRPCPPARPRPARQVAEPLPEGTDVRQVNVATEDQIHTGAGPRIDGLPMPVQDVGFVLSARHMDRLMGDHQTQLGGLRLPQPAAHARDLAGGHLAVLMTRRPGRVDPDHEQVGRREFGL